VSRKGGIGQTGRKNGKDRINWIGWIGRAEGLSGKGSVMRVSRKGGIGRIVEIMTGIEWAEYLLVMLVHPDSSSPSPPVWVASSFGRAERTVSQQ